MKLEEFDYYLPEELIAQVPIEKRDESRLMVLNRESKTIEHKTFRDIIDYLKPGDCLVRNNTKVIPARLYGKKETGANVEFVLLKQLEGDVWETIVRPGNKLKPGTVVKFGENKTVGKFGDNKFESRKPENSNFEHVELEEEKTENCILKATILDIMEGGTRKVQFEYDGIFNEILDKIGLMPLPPYIHESLKEKDRYQTVYAKYNGSAAAPTAGLHFTPELLKKIEEKGVNVTLHVGIGTFRPVKEENIEEHQMHTEHFYIKQEDVDKINETKKSGGRVIAVGTTSCRVLETIASDSLEEKGMVKATEGDTGIYIYPGYKFKCIDGLITNFHLPKSTLLMLVSALAGREFVLNAYNEAVKEKYRFFSFGDAMFIE